MLLSRITLYCCAPYRKLTIIIKIIFVYQLFCCLLISCTDDAQEKSPVIYVAGYERSTTTLTQNQATLWKNGSPIRLTNGTREAIAYAVVASGADVD